MNLDDPRSTSPASDTAEHEPTAALDEERRRKRGRDAAYGPSTPKGEGEEGKALGGLTPLAKKGRVQPAGISPSNGDRDSVSDSESVPADDDGNPVDLDRDGRIAAERTTPPPPPGLETSSAPHTPIMSGKPLPIRHEGTETRNIRQRVEALEWEDDSLAVDDDDLTAPLPTPAPTAEDMEVADVAAQVSESAEQIQAEDQVNEDMAQVAAEVGDEAQRLDGSGLQDVELAAVAAEVSSSAEVTHAQDQRDVEIADVADEVAVSAAHLGDDPIQDKPTAVAEGAPAPISEALAGEKKPVAEVAAEVGDTAEALANEDESFKESAKVADEVSDSAALVGDAQSKNEEVAEVAAEVGDTAETLDKPPTPPPSSSAAPPPPVPTTSFSSFSSAASPFASFTSSASPFAAVSPAPAPPRPGDLQKPKAKSAFPPMPSLVAPSTPVPASRSSAALSSSTFDSPVLSSGVRPPPPTPATPFARSVPSSSVPAAASPFSAFASSSGFAKAAVPPPAAASAGFGSYSAVTASPFAKVQASVPASEGPSRKLGEPVEEDPGKRVFTEQEVVTGEEDDETIHSVRAKLFVMADGAWAERGTGLLKLNVTREAGRSGARIVMRADATHRLLLNAVLFPNFSIEVSQEKYVRFAIIEANEPVSYMLRMSGTPTAVALVNAVEDRVALL